MISVDRDKCVGSRTCTSIAPHVFSIDKHGKSVPTDPHADPTEDLLDAVESCPVQAIAVQPAPPDTFTANG